jgi:hypothetical protein
MSIYHLSSVSIDPSEFLLFSRGEINRLEPEAVGSSPGITNISDTLRKKLYCPCQNHAEVQSAVQVANDKSEKVSKHGMDDAYPEGAERDVVRSQAELRGKNMPIS